MSDHEHDDEGNCIPPQNGFYATALPTWKFSGWDVAGIALSGIGGLFSVVGQGMNLLARECAAMANWTRQNYELEQAQREHDRERAEAAEALRALVEGDGEDQ